MRLLLWVLFATLAACPARCEADSSYTNKQLQRALYTKFASRGLIVNSYDDDQRFLRGESNKIAKDEERAIGQRLVNVLKEIKGRYLKWEQKILIPKFKELAEEGITTTKLSDDFWRQTYGFAWIGIPPGFKRFIRLYNTWVKTNYPNLADMKMK